MERVVANIGRITSLVVVEALNDPNTWSDLLKCTVLTDKGSFLVSSEPGARVFYGYVPIRVGDDFVTCIDKNLIALLVSILQDEKHVPAGTSFAPLSEKKVGEVLAKNSVPDVPTCQSRLGPEAVCRPRAARPRGDRRHPHPGPGFAPFA